MNKPIEISTKEWEEILKVEKVRDDWGLSDPVTAEEFASMVYGVKFKFMSGSPGYVGDLFIVQGDSLGNQPAILIRRSGVLEVIE